MPIEQIPKIIKNNISILPVFILLFFCIESVFDAYSSDWLLEIRNYLAFGSIILNIVVYFQFRRFYKFTLLGTLILGISNIFAFSADMEMAFVNLNGLKISFQLESLSAGIIAYIINFQKVNNIVLEIFRSKVPRKVQEKSGTLIFEDDLIKFKERYSNYTNDKLQEIISANKYVPEALEAAKQILKQRQDIPSNPE